MFALSGASHHDVGWEGGIKVFIGAVVKENVRLPHFNWRDSDILIMNIQVEMPKSL